MIRALHYAADGSFRPDIPLRELPHLVKKQEGLLWVSLEQPGDGEINAVLRDIFAFHPLAIEDAASREYQSPKVDDFDDYIFIIAHALRANFGLDRLDTELDTIELNCFLGEHYLVTIYRTAPITSIRSVWNRIERNQRPLQRGADFLCHAILDHLVDEYLPIIDAVDDELDRIEAEIFEEPHPDTLQKILTLKHNILVLRRVIGPQREVMNRLSRDDFSHIAPRNRIYYRDIYDHLVRLHDLSEATRDVISGTLDAYLSVTSHRLNEVMRMLAIISTIFLPLSFLAGVYGMNFDYMPLLNSPYGFVFIWGIFLAVSLGMLWLFKRWGWF